MPIFLGEVGVPYRTLRTIGASVVLAGLFVAGAIQVGVEGQPPGSEIVVTGPSTTTTGAVSTTEEPETSLPEEPFTYRIGVLSGVSTDNFWAYYGKEPSVWNSYILGPTKSSLYSVDGSGQLVPELIEEEVEPTREGSGWAVEVALSPDYRWSDGEPIDAADFVFTFETVRELGLGGSWAQSFPSSVESVIADGQYGLTIAFGSRPSLAVWPYGIGLAPVMAEHVWADRVTDGAEALYESSGSLGVSGGPLMLTEVSDTLVSARANDGYPGDAPDLVEYRVYQEEAALLVALAAGDIDTVLTPNGLTREQVAQVAGTSGVEVVSSPANAIRYLGFNLNRAPMSHVGFRKALALLVDRESASAGIEHSGESNWTMLPTANQQWVDEERAAAAEARYSGPVGERLERAVALLTDAGYSWTRAPSLDDDGSVVAGEGLTVDGLPLAPLTILTPGDAYDPARPEYAAWIADALGLLGFDVRPVETDFDTVVDLAFSTDADGVAQYDMYLLGWTLGNPALPAYYRPFFASKGAMNNTGYASKKFNQALKRYEEANTAAQAKDALWDMEEILADDLPYLPLYTSRLNEAYRSDHVRFEAGETLGGIQGRLGGIGDVSRTD